MLRIIESFGNLPINLEPEAGITFQPGHVATLKIKKGKTLVGICDGLHPLGLIDDIRSETVRRLVDPAHKRFVVQVSPDFTMHQARLKKPHKVKLFDQNIIAASFFSTVPGELDPVSGIFTLPKGTICNDKSTTSNYDCVNFTVNYAYNVHGKFEDSTETSKRITIWTKNMIAATDMYDVNREYQMYAPLYVENGLLTSRPTVLECKCIGMVLEGPNTNSSILKFLFDIEGTVQVRSF